MNTDIIIDVIIYFKTHYYLLFFIFYVMIIICNIFIILGKITKVAFELSEDELLFDLDHLDDKEKKVQIMTEINTKMNGKKFEEAIWLARKCKNLNKNLVEVSLVDIEKTYILKKGLNKNSNKNSNKKVAFKCENENYFY